jgi:hypothetical protein
LANPDQLAGAGATFIAWLLIGSSFAGGNAGVLPQFN